MALEEIVAARRVANSAAVELVSRLGPDVWHRLTPAEGWPVRPGRRMPRIALLGASVRHVDVHAASIRAAIAAEAPA